jgi:hypothetical protein
MTKIKWKNLKEEGFNKSFEQLIAEKANCLEFALNGFIRLYEKGKECFCSDCIHWRELQRLNFDKNDPK